MLACTTAGGGVMFIPETLERHKAAISYAELLRSQTTGAVPEKPFGRRKTDALPENKKAREAA